MNIFYIILSGIIALFVALFLYKSTYKNHPKLAWILSGLRFLSVFILLMLLINPKTEKISTTQEKPNLIIAVDNSESVAFLNQEKNVSNILSEIGDDLDLQEKFDINYYQLDRTIRPLDSLSFSENQTNLDQVFSQLSQIYRDNQSPTIVITDGNQTYGNDYVFSSRKYEQAVYPIILGDSTVYNDLKIQQLNTNKYAYLKNKFPLEVILNYNGEASIQSKFQILSGNNIVFSQNVSFSVNENSKILNLYLPANNVGVFTYKAVIQPLDNEKNVINNEKNFAVEVIDEKTKVAIVSELVHPDLGALKKSIESNELREAVIVNSSEYLSQINDFQLAIIYQPNSDYQPIFEEIKKNDLNSWIITGPKTDWNFLNNLGLSFKHDITNQSEDVQPILNTAYSNFMVEDIDFNSFPPLKTSFGDIDLEASFSSILYQKIGSITTEKPLLLTYENKQARHALLLGEDIWKWRAQNYLNTKSFSEFDTFIGKLVQYLASNKRKDRLTVDYESFYEGNNSISIKAQFFDKNYEFDSRESLEINLKNTETGEVITLPFVLKNNYYEVDLSSLLPSDYEFTVSASHEIITSSGKFKILDYNVEQQFLNADVTKLQQLATNSQGKSYFVSDYASLINDLINDERYKPILKTNRNLVPIIEWKYLLALLVILLGIEWFIRKYNGLI